MGDNLGTFCPTCQLGGSAPPRELSSQVLVVKCHRYLCWATATAVLGALTSLGWEQNLRGDRPSRQRGADCRVARKWRVTLSRRFVWKLGEGWGHGWIRDGRRHGGAAPAPGPHRAQSRLPVPEGPSPSPSPGKPKPSLKVAWNLLLEGPGGPRWCFLFLVRAQGPSPSPPAAADRPAARVHLALQ